MDSQSHQRRSKEVPFYETSKNAPTSAKIVSEARDALVRSNLRSVQTKRPETPQDGQRNLFGEQSVRDPSNRPLSAFSIGSRHFNDAESRPVSGTRLSPLEHTPRIITASDVERSIAPRPPSGPGRSGIRRSNSKHRLQQSISVESGQPPTDNNEVNAVPESALPGSSTPNDNSSTRRIRSGPKERTEHRSSSGKSSRRHSKDDARDSSHPSREGSSHSHRTHSAGKPSSAGRREEETSDELEFYNSHISPVLEQMNAASTDKDHDTLITLTDRLYNTLDRSNLLGKNCKRRSAILKTVYHLLDAESPEYLLKLAQLILSLKVSGNNLTNVCKLVFKCARDEKNDCHFLKGNVLSLLVDTIRYTDPLLSSDALVYCVGAVKLLSGTSSFSKLFVKNNCIEATGKLLHTINTQNRETGKGVESLGHVLVQLTGCIRNLADISSLHSHFVTHGVITDLCTLLETNQTDGDLMLNVARIFSKITTHSECCHKVASHRTVFKSFIHLLKVYQRQQDLTVRLCFMLGNLVAKSDDARICLYDEPGSMDVILSVFKCYCDFKAKPDIDEKTLKDREDVLMKLIRIIANMSINETIGPKIAANKMCIKQLLQVLEHKDLAANEELILNTVATITNLSFYNNDDSVINKEQVLVAEVLLKFLEPGHMDVLTEVSRVYGNLSRFKPVRDLLVKNMVDDFMVTLLDSGKRDVVYTVCGVLVNLMADEDKRPNLKKLGGIKLLTDVLQEFGPNDWQLASLVCQVLWNYSGRITSANAYFGEKQSQELMDLLTEYLDEDAVLSGELSGESNGMHGLMCELWKDEFYPVANDLLQRIEKYSSNFEPL